MLFRLDVPMRDAKLMLRSLRCPVDRHGTIGRYIYLRGTRTGFGNGCPPSILPHLGLGSYNTFDSAALNASNGPAQDEMPCQICRTPREIEKASAGHGGQSLNRMAYRRVLLPWPILVGGVATCTGLERERNGGIYVALVKATRI